MDQFLTLSIDYDTELIEPNAEKFLRRYIISRDMQRQQIKRVGISFYRKKFLNKNKYGSDCSAVL